MDKTDLVTKVNRTFQRADGSEVRLVAETMYGAGLHPSTNLYGLRRESPDRPWVLLNDRPHPDWKSMSVDEYKTKGRSELLRAVSHGEILKLVSCLGRPMSEFAQAQITDETTDKVAGMNQSLNEILEQGSAIVVYEWARSHACLDNVAALQARLLEVGDAIDCYLFARDVPGADIRTLQARVLADGNVWRVTEFSCIPGADVEVLYAHVQTRGFAGLDEARRAAFDVRLAEYRAQRQQAGQDDRAEVEDAEPASPAPAA